MNKNEFILVINGNPVSASRPRISGRCRYYNEPYKSYKTLLSKEIDKLIPKDKSLLFEQYEPLSVEIVYEMPIPKMSPKKTASMIGAYHTKKPDLDNLDKAILDALSCRVFKDDSQVAKLSAVKKYSDTPCTIVIVRKIEL